MHDELHYPGMKRERGICGIKDAEIAEWGVNLLLRVWSEYIDR